MDNIHSTLYTIYNKHTLEMKIILLGRIILFLKILMKIITIVLLNVKIENFLLIFVTFLKSPQQFQFVLFLGHFKILKRSLIAWLGQRSFKTICFCFV